MRVLLTSDVHLGMKFANVNYPDDLRKSLVEARFRVVDRLIEVANAEECDLFVVAGDLFDRVRVAEEDILKAAHSLSEFQGELVAVLPGNHDYLVPDRSDLWDRFEEHAGDNVLVMRETRPHSLVQHGLDAVLYSAPCSSKHSASNAVSWMGDVERDDSVRHHIGIAHGSLEGFSPDFDKTYYPMTERELLSYGLDLWLLGHTHVQYPTVAGSMDRVFYAGTPEPDGFGCAHEGKAWLLDIDKGGAVVPMSLSTGVYRFLHDSVELATVADCESLRTKYHEHESEKALVKLKLSGRLAEEAYESLDEIREVVKEQVLYLDWDDSLVTREVTTGEIDRIYTVDSFPHTLLTRLSESEEDTEALQEAYDLLNEVKQ